MKHIRDLLKTTRLENSTSLADLAKLLDVPVAKLEAFESGASSLEVELLFGLVNALNIDPEDFLNLLSREVIDTTSDSATELLSLRIRAKLKSV